MEILGFIVMYVLPLLFQLALQVTVLSFGVYLGLRRYDKYKELSMFKEYKTQNRRKSIL